MLSKIAVGRHLDRASVSKSLRGKLNTTSQLESAQTYLITVLPVSHHNMSNYHPETTDNHNRSGAPPATPVRLCRVCWTTHHSDTTGSTSRELEEWYCSEGCRYIRRLRVGLLESKDSPEIYTEVLKMWKRQCPHDLIQHRRDKVMARIANKQERVIREVVDEHE
jgi:hypothetical protein